MVQLHKIKGFTLIELLVVIGIIGILALLAVGNFQEYKARAHNATARQDLRNIATAEEAYYVDNSAYLACDDKDECISVLPGIESVNEHVSLAVEVSAGGDVFTGTATSSKGTGITFNFVNVEGWEDL